MVEPSGQFVDDNDTVEPRRQALPRFWWLRVAASSLGLLLLSGTATAATEEPVGKAAGSRVTDLVGLEVEVGVGPGVAFHRYPRMALATGYVRPTLAIVAGPRGTLKLGIRGELYGNLTPNCCSGDSYDARLPGWTLLGTAGFAFGAPGRCPGFELGMGFGAGSQVSSAWSSPGGGGLVFGIDWRGSLYESDHVGVGLSWSLRAHSIRGQNFPNDFVGLFTLSIRLRPGEVPTWPGPKGRNHWSS